MWLQCTNAQVVWKRTFRRNWKLVTALLRVLSLFRGAVADSSSHEQDRFTLRGAAAERAACQLAGGAGAAEALAGGHPGTVRAVGPATCGTGGQRPVLAGGDGVAGARQDDRLQK